MDTNVTIIINVQINNEYQVANVSSWEAFEANAKSKLKTAHLISSTFSCLVPS